MVLIIEKIMLFLFFLGQSIFFCFIYAITDEFHQTFITGRTGQFSDVIIDTIGASIGSIVYSIVYKKIKNI